LTDYCDVSNLSQHSDLVTKAVTLLRIMAEYITQEKKKQEEELKEPMEVVGDQIMRIEQELMRAAGELEEEEKHSESSHSDNEQPIVDQF
jgi:hypothetical protein